MPCRDYQDDTTEVRDLNTRIEQLKTRNDELTKMLCALCKSTPQKQIQWASRDFDVPLTAWWATHKAEDEKHKDEEDRKKRAFAILTIPERKKLGWL